MANIIFLIETIQRANSYAFTSETKMSFWIFFAFSKPRLNFEYFRNEDDPHR